MEGFIVDDYHKGIDAVADSDTCYDKPEKKQKHPIYEYKTRKMMMKNNEFSDKKFQRVRHVSNKKKLLKSFQRIGRCLNNVSRDDMPKNGYDKVCLVLLTSNEHSKHDPKVGVLNDGYLFALYHHRLGFKVFYLYNCTEANYPKFLRFFLYNTTESLTVYYSGPGRTPRGDSGVEFKDTTLTAYQLGHVICRDSNGRSKVLFVSDCTSSGSVFDISRVGSLEDREASPMISISTKKSADPDSKEGRRSHGILTYYLCKVIYDDPSVTVERCVDRLNSFIARFGQTVICEVTDPKVLKGSMYNPCHHSCHHPAVDPAEEMIEEIGTDDSSTDDETDSSSA